MKYRNSLNIPYCRRRLFYRHYCVQKLKDGQPRHHHSTQSPSRLRVEVDSVSTSNEYLDRGEARGFRMEVCSRIMHTLLLLNGV